MELLLLFCLLSPLIFAQPYKPKKDPNDEPFLPIHPVYPYNPKLIKRGTERELISPLTPELYVPKVDAKDSYSSSYSNNYQRDPYYPDYNSYPKNTSPSSAYSSYYSGDGYAYANSPYATYNSYPTPYTVNPTAYSMPSYPNYYYQQPYYYPHYFNHALYAQPQLPPPSSVDHHETSQDSTEAEDDKQDNDKKSEKPKEDETNQDASTSQFVDGRNYISGNSRDLDGQSSTYKIASPYNEVERNQVQVKNLPIPLPRTTYRVISVAGQPVGPDYPLPAPYVKAQQMEQAMSETLAKLLAQYAQQQPDQSYENGRNVLNGVNDGSYANQDAYNPNTPYSTLPKARTKTGVTYVINSDSTAKANRERASLRGSPSQRTSNKNTKYANIYYSQKPALQVTYVPSDNSDKNRDRAIGNRPADQTDEYGGYDATQNYGGAYSQSRDKQEQNYDNYQSQSDSYQNKDFAVTPQTPRSYSYQYSAYESDQVQQPQQDKIYSNDGNFGAKQYTKE